MGLNIVFWMSTFGLSTENLVDQRQFTSLLGNYGGGSPCLMIMVEKGMYGMYMRVHVCTRSKDATRGSWHRY